MARQYKSVLMASVHEAAEGLHAAGAIDRQTMRKFDDVCLTPVRELLAADTGRFVSAKA